MLKETCNLFTPSILQRCRYFVMPICFRSERNMHKSSALACSIAGYRRIRNGSQSVPSHARVVICGAGIIGNSVAYHLVENGWTDVVVLDQGSVGCGTSWHGSGLLGQFRSPSERPLVTYTAQLCAKLQREGFSIGWSPCGSLNFARTKDRMISLKRFFTSAEADGLECHLVTPKEMMQLHPYLHAADLEGGVWVPSDGVVDPMELCLTLAKCAEEAGVEYIGSCEAEKLLSTNGRISAVQTNLRTIQCDYFVNCSGLWARDLGEKSDPKVRIPVHAAEHLYITTKPSVIAPLNATIPVIRDYDGSLYCRQLKGRFLAGCFGTDTRPVFHEGVPESFQFRLLEGNTDQCAHLVECLKTRLPVMKKLEVEHVFHGPENFSADGRWIFGETPEVKNYFVAVGMNGNSIQSSGGVGKAIAEWIIEGEPTANLLPFDIKRFRDLHNNKKFLRERVKEIAASHYKLMYPMHSEFQSARKMRCSPLYTEQEAAGAVFGEAMGFERALYFDTSVRSRSQPAQMTTPTFGKPGWFDFVREEYFTCREGVGIIDFSSLTKFALKSPGTEVVDYLQLLCSSDINIPVGSIVQTGMQNERGGFENDCIVLRTAENNFLMICPAVQHTRMTDWMNQYLPLDGSITIRDVSSMYTVLNIVGPKSKELMTEMTNVDMSIPPFTFKEVNLGYASGIRTLGFSHVGEPGYSLFVPSEYALHIYERFMEVGEDYGIRNVGHFANMFLRIEKLIPSWAEELNSNTTPNEVGRGHKVKFEKDYFLGKFALMKQHEKGVMKRLVHFTLENHDADNDLWAWSDEPIYRNGEFVGRTTSSGYGFTVGSIVCMGFVKDVNTATGEERIVTSDFITGKGVSFEIDIAGKKFAAKASLHPPKIPLITMDNMSRRYIPKAKKTLS